VHAVRLRGVRCLGGRWFRWGVRGPLADPMAILPDQDDLLGVGEGHDVDPVRVLEDVIGLNHLTCRGAARVCSHRQPAIGEHITGVGDSPIHYADLDIGPQAV
jgi:hypothetical protein